MEDLWDDVSNQWDAGTEFVGEIVDDGLDSAGDALDTGLDWTGNTLDTGLDWAGEATRTGLDRAGDQLDEGLDQVGLDEFGDDINTGFDMGGNFAGTGLDLLGDVTGGALEYGGDLANAGMDLGGHFLHGQIDSDYVREGDYAEDLAFTAGTLTGDTLDLAGDTIAWGRDHLPTPVNSAIEERLNAIDGDKDGAALDDTFGFLGGVTDRTLDSLSGGFIDTDLARMGEDLGDMTSDALGTRGEHPDDPLDQQVLDDTQAHRPEVYDTIEKRSEYYDEISDHLQAEPGTEQIKFFQAASEVTNEFGVGIVEQPPEQLLNGTPFDLHSPIAEELLTDINAKLLDENMNVIERTLDRGYASDPSNPGSTERLQGLDFDLRMVEFEQGNVERFLGDFQKDHSPEEYQEALQNLNTDLNFDGAIRQFGAGTRRPDTESIEDARAALGLSEEERLDFSQQEHREAIGKAKIFNLHGKSDEEYLDYMKNN